MVAALPQFKGKDIFTIAVCGSAKKHRQSFEAIKRAAARHNTALRQSESSHLALNFNDDSSGIAKPAGFDLAGLGLASEVDSGGLSTSVQMPPCFFRFVSLNYDAQDERMVLAPTFDVTEDSAGEKDCVLPHTGDGDLSRKSGLYSEHRHTNGHLLETNNQTSSLCFNDRLNGLGRKSSVDSHVRPEEVDVILHKVITYGLPEVTRALHAWCERVSQLRISFKRPPLMVLDSIDKMQVLSLRSVVYKFLDNLDAGHHSSTLMPRTFWWESPETSKTPKCEGDLGVDGNGVMSISPQHVFTPIGTHSSLLESEKPHTHSASHLSGENWWVAKPDECTGLSYTHDLVIWKSPNAEVWVPPEIQATLNVEPSAYIIQEFYTYAFPVVVKVYCVGSDIFIKVKPTNKLLSLVLDQVGSKDGFDKPVKVNSQNKAIFSLEWLSLLGAGPASRESLLNSVYNGHETEHQMAPLSCGVHPEHWEAFFAEGTPAWAAVVDLVKGLSGQQGLGLHLYGFDILLVPSALAHQHHVEAYPKGIGYTEGATVSYQPPPVVSSTKDPHHPESMFDLQTGAPTTYLMGSVPVVIDVNYFPGYSGMEIAMRGILKLMWKLGDGETLRCSHKLH
ncbi:unnamed protein product [Phytomonas sp. Hart1]|nr:unnamed protein product [Phytomonas sp. Hart1]|eukprot:CCW65939.1 unnamed protein product [Phytomonas sp. isolate Hart1]